MRGRIGWLVVVTGVGMVAPAPAAAQSTTWSFHTRLLATGTNRASDPDGYRVYSAFPLEVGLRAALGGRLRAELSVRTESREVDRLAQPTDERLGSLESLALNGYLQYRLSNRTVRPYLGVGVNATMVWEKAGVIDSMRASPSLGPGLQAGLDVPLNDYLAFNLDVRWNAWSTTIKPRGGARLVRLDIDPAAFGIGLVVRW